MRLLKDLLDNPKQDELTEEDAKKLLMKKEGFEAGKKRGFIDTDRDYEELSLKETASIAFELGWHNDYESFKEFYGHVQRIAFREPEEPEDRAECGYCQEEELHRAVNNGFALLDGEEPDQPASERYLKFQEYTEERASGTEELVFKAYCHEHDSEFFQFTSSDF